MLFSEFPDKQKPTIVKSLARSLDSITHKIRFFVYYFFTPGSADLRAIKIPDILFPIYYLLRPLRFMDECFNSIKEKTGAMKKRVELDFEERVKHLSPELQLLLWSIRVDEKLTDAAEKILYSKNVISDFESFKRLTFSKGVLSLLYKKIKTLDMDKLDPGLVHVFKEAYMEILSRNIKLTNQLKIISELLIKNNLDMIAFKGPTLGVIAYGDIAYRSSADLDILVSNVQFPTVVEVIRKTGFLPRFQFKEKIIKYLQKSWRDIHLEKGFYHIDIHQQLAQGPSFFRSTPEKLGSGTSVKFDDLDIATLSPEETLVMMAINCAKEGFSSLKHFSDISGIILNNPHIKWERVWSSARDKRCFNILQISLGLSQIFCGLHLSPEIALDINIKTIAKKLEAFTKRVLTFSFDNESIHAYFSFGDSLDSLSSRIRFYFWYLFSPSPQLHGKIFTLPVRLFFLIPVMSPFYLLFSHLNQLLKSRIFHHGK